MLCPFARLASVLILAVAPSAALADTLYTDTQALFGRIISIDPAGITLDAGCSGSDRHVLPWSDARDVVFDTRCNAPQARIPSAGGGICSKTPTKRFLIHLVGQERPLAASSLRLGQDGILHFRDEARSTDGHASRGSVRGITYGLVCPDDVAEGNAPAGVCIEPITRAVNFSFDTPFDNRILTRGFAYYLEFGEPGMEQGRDIGQLREMVRQGFGTALTWWVSELWRRREHYSPAMQTVLESFVARGQNIAMVLPPQVVAKQCPAAANFVVRLYTAEAGPFAPGPHAYAAFAQRPGRTIALNMGKYPCWENSNSSSTVNPETHCVNIVPIFVHELGHALGLNHVDESDSVMQAIVTVGSPSARDTDRLAAQLQRAIDGGAPGLLQVGTDTAGIAPVVEGISIEQR